MGAALADGADLEGAQGMTLSEHAERNREAWTGWRRSTRRPPSEPGRRTRSPGASGSCPRRRCARCRTWPARTSSSSAAAPRTSRPGSPEGRARRRASTSRRRSSRRRARCRRSSGSSSRWSRRAPRTCRCPDESFDLAVSEYGASIWADPYLWIPEAARLLRPGRRARLPRQRHDRSILCLPGRRRCRRTSASRRPYFGMHRFEWPDDDPGVDFHLGLRRLDPAPARERLRGR